MPSTIAQAQAAIAASVGVNHPNVMPPTMMAGWEGRISDTEIWQIVDYLRALAANGAAGAPVTTTPRMSPKVSTTRCRFRPRIFLPAS